jgi:hypothetical protein
MHAKRPSQRPRPGKRIARSELAASDMTGDCTGNLEEQRQFAVRVD